MRHLSTVLEHELDLARFGLGVQMHVRWGDEVLVDAALGTTVAGRPLATTTLHQVWCLTKPIVAFAVGLAADDGLVELDSPVDAVCPELAQVHGLGITPLDLMNHRAGLVQPSMVGVRSSVPEARPGLVATASTDGRRVLFPTPGYSDYVAWWVLERILDGATGDGRRFVRERVLDPLGLHDTFFGMTREQFADHRGSIGTYFADLPDRPVPLLHDLTESVATDGGLALGGYSTMADIGRFFATVQRVRQAVGEPEPGLPSPHTTRRLLSSRRGRFLDVVLRRPCDFAGGCMIGLADHHFGDAPSPSAFGSAGWHGSTFAFADPAADLAVAVLFNGMSFDFPAVEDLRHRVTDAVYADLAELRVGPTVDAGAVPAS